MNTKAERVKTGAVIYCRVSTREQLDNLSLPVQEKVCREYCAKHGWQVLHVFREAESAKTLERDEFQRMLEFCAHNHKEIVAVVFYDTSRFSRETEHYQHARGILKMKGIVTRAATQPFDESPGLGGHLKSGQ